MSDKTITTLHPDVRERFLIENFDILSIQGSLESMDCIFLQQIILMGSDCICCSGHFERSEGQ